MVWKRNHHLLSFRQWRSDLQECLPKQSASGGKGDAWEGGFRVPFALQWKGRLPQGAVYQKPVSALDLGGTVVALSGAEVPEGKPLDGVNLIPYLTGRTRGRLMKRFIFANSIATGSRCVRAMKRF
ncbi:MAG: hypothetical protein CM15mP130_1660 [Verrucomicrobiota bacterium]|nr:MAG: hypothetical protein CM15mP130_1660 [Verrucomicrobiota bacterium]